MSGQVAQGEILAIHVGARHLNLSNGSNCQVLSHLVIMATWRIIPFSKWLIAMVIVSPQFLGLWDPFQMAEIYGL